MPKPPVFDKTQLKSNKENICQGGNTYFMQTLDKNLKELNSMKYRYVSESTTKIPVHILITGDVNLLQNWYDNSNLDKNSDDMKHIADRISIMNYYNELSMHQNSNKPESDQISTLSEKTVNGRRGIFVDGVKLQEHQNSGNGCWSCAYNMLLQSRGINLDQRVIRMFRTDNLEVTDTMLLEEVDRINGDKFNEIFANGELLGKVCPNTMVVQMSVNGNYDTLHPGQNNTAEIEKFISEAFFNDKSPVAFCNGTHWRTIIGYNSETHEVTYQDSMSTPDNYYTETISNMFSYGNWDFTKLKTITINPDGTSKDLNKEFLDIDTDTGRVSIKNISRDVLFDNYGVINEDPIQKGEGNFFTVQNKQDTSLTISYYVPPMLRYYDSMTYEEQKKKYDAKYPRVNNAMPQNAKLLSDFSYEKGIRELTKQTMSDYFQEIGCDDDEKKNAELDNLLAGGSEYTVKNKWGNPVDIFTAPGKAKQTVNPQKAFGNNKNSNSITSQVDSDAEYAKKLQEEYNNELIYDEKSEFDLPEYPEYEDVIKLDSVNEIEKTNEIKQPVIKVSKEYIPIGEQYLEYNAITNKKPLNKAEEYCFENSKQTAKVLGDCQEIYYYLQNNFFTDTKLNDGSVISGKELRKSFEKVKRKPFIELTRDNACSDHFVMYCIARGMNLDELKRLQNSEDPKYNEIKGKYDKFKADFYDVVCNPDEIKRKDDIAAYYARFMDGFENNLNQLQKCKPLTAESVAQYASMGITFMSLGYQTFGLGNRDNQDTANEYINAINEKLKGMNKTYTFNQFFAVTPYLGRLFSFALEANKYTKSETDISLDNKRMEVIRRIGYSQTRIRKLEEFLGNGEKTVAQILSDLPDMTFYQANKEKDYGVNSYNIGGYIDYLENDAYSMIKNNQLDDDSIRNFSEIVYDFARTIPLMQRESDDKYHESAEIPRLKEFVSKLADKATQFTTLPDSVDRIISDRKNTVLLDIKDFAAQKVYTEARRDSEEYLDFTKSIMPIYKEEAFKAAVGIKFANTITSRAYNLSQATTRADKIKNSINQSQINLFISERGDHKPDYDVNQKELNVLFDSPAMKTIIEDGLEVMSNVLEDDKTLEEVIFGKNYLEDFSEVSLNKLLEGRRTFDRITVSNSEEYNRIGDELEKLNKNRTNPSKAHNLESYMPLYNACCNYVKKKNASPNTNSGQYRFDAAADLMQNLGLKIRRELPEYAEKIERDFKILSIRSKNFRNNLKAALQDNDMLKAYISIAGDRIEAKTSKGMEPGIIRNEEKEMLVLNAMDTYVKSVMLEKKKKLERLVEEKLSSRSDKKSNSELVVNDDSDIRIDNYDPKTLGK